MAPKQPCEKYQYVVTESGPKILPVEEESCKDEESPADYNAGGYLPVHVGDTFKDMRYRVVRKLGWGHFSTVWLVKDAHTQSHSALKVVKSAGRYAETARDEIKLLSKVSSFAPAHPGRPHIVSFLDSFSHQGPEASHICIVFEPLGENLLALIERSKRKGVPQELVKVISKQILLGLQYLHDECDLVHTDIKPENILISIPDVEEHIHNELSQSPSPTCRRVGIPPNKSRGGVTIPHNPNRIRRQVQIFDSQPLASPGRSAGKAGSGRTNVSNPGQGSIGSGSGSQSSSFITKTALSGTGGYSNFQMRVSGTAASLGSTAPKVPSNLSKSVPFVQKAVIGTVDSEKPVTTSSTSSSSSSLSSALASVNAGSSSITSTPPSSLSISIGTAMSAFMAVPRGKASVDAELERRGIPMKGNKGKEKVTQENELGGVFSEWQFRLASSSLKDKLPASYKSTSANSKLSRKSVMNNHNRTQSGLSAPSYWQDLGAATLAPAVVVSAVANAVSTSHCEGSFLPQLPNIRTSSSRTIGGSPNSSTTTMTRPSPAGPINATESPNLIAEQVDSTLDDNKHINTNSTILFNPKPIVSHPVPTNHCLPSLLTQTAPIRVTSPSHIKRNIPIRNSPQLLGSQISAHMYTQTPPPDYKSPTTSHAPYFSFHTSRHNSRASVTPTPDSPTLAVPPPSPEVSPLLNKIPLSRDHESYPRSPTPIPPPISIKIADLGNATPSTKHFTEDIQTRQYRAPEAIIGRRDWDARADIWSVACVVFELLTAEYLFDPQGQGGVFSKDDDHMAQIIELLGDFDLSLKMSGSNSLMLFELDGTLRYISTLKPWPLKCVMREKYLFSDPDAKALCDFLQPMLKIDPGERKHARDMIDHPWLQTPYNDNFDIQW